MLHRWREVAWASGGGDSELPDDRKSKGETQTVVTRFKKKKKSSIQVKVLPVDGLAVKADVQLQGE